MYLPYIERKTLYFSLYSTNILVRSLTVYVRPQSRNPLKMQPHNSQSRRENAAPSSGPSLLASYKEAPPPPLPPGERLVPFSFLLAPEEGLFSKRKYWAICLNVYFLFYSFVTSSSPCRKDQFAVSYFSINIHRSISFYISGQDLDLAEFLKTLPSNRPLDPKQFFRSKKKKLIMKIRVQPFLTLASFPDLSFVRVIFGLVGRNKPCLLAFSTQITANFSRLVFT